MANKNLERNRQTYWLFDEDGEFAPKFFSYMKHKQGRWASEKQGKFFLSKIGFPYEKCISDDERLGDTWLRKLAVQHGIQPGMNVTCFTLAHQWGDVYTRTNYSEHIFIFDVHGIYKYLKRTQTKGVELIWQRDWEPEPEQETVQQEQKPVSNWVGEIGKRLPLVLKVTNYFDGENDYGEYRVHICVDKDGNIFKWRTSTWCFERGDYFTCNATIVEHTTYTNKRTGEEVKQTVITNCRKIKEVDGWDG